MYEDALKAANELRDERKKNRSLRRIIAAQALCLLFAVALFVALALRR